MTIALFSGPIVFSKFFLSEIVMLCGSVREEKVLLDPLKTLGFQN